MEFLKALFGDGALTYAQLSEKIKGAGKDGKDMKLADLSHGGYVSAEKHRAAETERDESRQQLAEIGEKLKAFDGVDVASLRGEIDALKGDLTKKDADYQAQLAERDFSAVVSAEITAAKGKNAKAIAALLNTDTLKASKNQQADVASAIKALRESDPYLFEEGQSAEQPAAKVSSGGAHGEGNGSPAKKSLQEMMAEANADPTKLDEILSIIEKSNKKTETGGVNDANRT